MIESKYVYIIAFVITLVVLFVFMLAMLWYHMTHTCQENKVEHYENGEPCNNQSAGFIAYDDMVKKMALSDEEINANYDLSVSMNMPTLRSTEKNATRGDDPDYTPFLGFARRVQNVYISPDARSVPSAYNAQSEIEPFSKLLQYGDH